MNLNPIQPPMQRTSSLLCLIALIASIGCNGSAKSSEQAPKPTDSTVAKTDKPETPSNKVVLSEEAFRTAQIETQVPGVLSAGNEATRLEVPGQIEVDPRRIALVSTRTKGRIERLSVVEGDRVEAGQIVGYFYSAEFLTAQNDLSQATRRAQILKGTADETGARALVDAARRRLRLIGVEQPELDALAGQTEPLMQLPLRAPIAGSVIESHVLPGSAIEPGAPVFTIADLSVVDVVAEIPERALPEVRLEQRASVSVNAFPLLKFEGRVERLRDALNPETRTLPAVIHVPNAGYRLRPGMFATVSLDVSSRDAGVTSTNRMVLTIPETALITDGDQRFVFVETAPRTYEKREVRVSTLTAAGSGTLRTSLVAVHDGLNPGERVVVNGAFTLKSELAKASLGESD